MKKELCQAFCSELDVSEVPAGFSVGTGYAGHMGDAIAFYLVGPDSNGNWTIQDDGTTVPYLEAMGAGLNVSTRAEAFEFLLEEYGASFDGDTCELRAGPMRKEDIPPAAMQFVALLLRVQDLALLTAERARSTWVEEATQMLENAVGPQVTLERDAAVSEQLDEFPADVVLKAQGGEPGI